MIWRTEGQIKVAIGFTGVVERADLVGVERDRVTFFVTVVGGVGSNMGNTREDKNSEDYKRRRVAKVSHFRSDNNERKRKTCERISEINLTWLGCKASTYTLIFFFFFRGSELGT